MIYIECNSDFTLLKSVSSIPRSQVIHELKGKSEICRKLATHSNCGALIDEDPNANQPPYLQVVRQRGTEQTFPEHSFKVLHDSKLNNYLVILCPKLEDWSLKLAKDAGVDILNYNLPDTPGSLHHVIGHRLGNYERLLEAIKSKGSERLAILKNLLRTGRP
jgi:hypothetical protein